MDEIVIDVDTAAVFLNWSVPNWEWTLRHLESEAGHFRFPPLVTRAIVNLKIEVYPLLDENESAIGLIMFRALLTQDEIVELNAKLLEQSPEQRGETLREMVAGLSQFDEVFEIPKTPAEEKYAQAAFDAMSNEDQAEAVKVAQYLWMGFLAGFFQSLSVMVHGEKLTSLVAQAKAGNDAAFCKADQAQLASPVRLFFENQPNQCRTQCFPMDRSAGVSLLASRNFNGGLGGEWRPWTAGLGLQHWVCSLVFDVLGAGASN